jgi:hypothetical protein
MDLQTKALAGDLVAVIDFALLEGSLGRITLEQVEARLQGKKLSDAQQKSLEAVRAVGTLDEAVKMVEAGRGSPEAFQKAAALLKPLLARGVVPESREHRMQFYSILLRYGMEAKDPETAQKALDGFKPLLPQDNPKVAPWLKAQQDRIDAMTAEKQPSGESESEPEEEAEGEEEEIEEDDG